MRKNVVQVKQIVEKMNLKNLTPDVELSDKAVEVPDINRPALQLTGFFERFDAERVQVIGYVEYSYLTTLDEKKKEEIYDTLLSYKIPCLVFCRALKPKGNRSEYSGIFNRFTYICIYGRSHTVVKCSVSTMYFHPWSTGRCLRCRCADYGREWYWKK